MEKLFRQLNPDNLDSVTLKLIREILEQNIQNNLEEINLTNENDINNTDIDNAYHHVQIIDRC